MSNLRFLKNIPTTNPRPLEKKDCDEKVKIKNVIEVEVFGQN